MALAPADYRRLHGRLADFELKWPERWPAWLGRLAAHIVERDPSESVRRHFRDFRYREVYFGAGFVCSGTAP